MPTYFRPARPSRRFARGKPAPHGAGSLRIAAGVSAGAASVVGVASAIVTAIGSTAGAASVNGVAVAIKAFAGASVGSAACSSTGVAIKAAVGASAGAATVTSDYIPYPITSTQVLNKPVDYVLAGQQNMHRQRLGRAAARHAFGE